MDFTRIRYFLAVVRLGQVTAAARELYVTQPAVSLALRALEREIGVPLFERRRGRLTLTPAGERFEAAATQAFRRLEEGRLAATQISRQPAGPLRIGATDVASVHLLPAVLSRFHSAYPAVEISIQVDSSKPLLEAVVRESLDFALVTLPADHTDLEVKPIRPDPMALVLSPKHPLTKRRIRAKDLEGQPILLYRRGSTTRALIDRELAARRIAPRVVVETGHPEVMKQLVAAGLGISILPAVSVAEEARAGKLAVRPVPGGPLVREIGLIRRRDREGSTAVRLFLQMLAGRIPRPRSARAAQRAKTMRPVAAAPAASKRER